METTERPHSKHIGKKIARIRELRGMKQETLAYDMGISQQAVSKIEQSEELEKETLERVGKALGVSPEAIENFNEEAVINIISSTFQDNASVTSHYSNCNLTFNPVDKIVDLYERLLAAEREKVEMMKKGKG